MPNEHVIQVRLRFDSSVGPVPLQPGAHNRVVVVVPRLVEYSSASGFANASAFPGPGVLADLKGIQEAVDGTRAQAVLFGHTDASGSDAANKALSDLRAEAIRAAFLSDAAAMKKVAHDNEWGVAEAQVMLRALGYVPGAIDGEVGPMTRAAVEDFVFEHGRGEHPRSQAPTQGPELDAGTIDALLGAYVAEYGMQMPADTLLGPQTVGCGAFNPSSSDPTSCRKVTLSVLEDAREHPDAGEFPCKTGDPSACLVDRVQAPRCRFYRTFVVAQAQTSSLDFFDFRWTRTPTGKVHLSALCNASDCDGVDFRVGIAKRGMTLPPASSSAGSPEPEVTILAEISGYVRHGVCYALWNPGEFDPFDAFRWATFGADVDDEDVEEVEAFPVPTFRIGLGAEWAYATPPGRPLHRIIVERDQGDLVALLADGSFVRVKSGDPRLDEDYDPNRYAVAMFPSGRILKWGGA